MRKTIADSWRSVFRQFVDLCAGDLLICALHMNFTCTPVNFQIEDVHTEGNKAASAEKCAQGEFGPIEHFLSGNCTPVMSGSNCFHLSFPKDLHVSGG